MPLTEEEVITVPRSYKVCFEFSDFKPLNETHRPEIQWRHTCDFLSHAKLRAKTIQSYVSFLSETNNRNIKSIVTALREQRRLRPLANNLLNRKHSRFDEPEDPLLILEAVISSYSSPKEVTTKLQSVKEILEASVLCGDMEVEGPSTPPPNESPEVPDEGSLDDTSEDEVPQLNPEQLPQQEATTFGLNLFEAVDETPCLPADPGSDETKRRRLSGKQSAPGAYPAASSLEVPPGIQASPARKVGGSRKSGKAKASPKKK